MLVVLNKQSSAIQILREYGIKHLYSYDEPDLDAKTFAFLSDLLNQRLPEIRYNKDAIETYSAENMTRHQCLLFDKVVNE